MDKKTSWDDIPSLNLEMDKGDTEDRSDEHGTPVTLTAREVISMLLDDIKVIPVQVTVKDTILSPRGTAEELREDGICFSLPGHNLTIKTILLTETVIGKQVFSIEAYVHTIDGDRVEVNFLDPDKEYTNFLKDMLSAKVLSYKI